MSALRVVMILLLVSVLLTSLAGPELHGANPFISQLLLEADT